MQAKQNIVAKGPAYAAGGRRLPALCCSHCRIALEREDQAFSCRQCAARLPFSDSILSIPTDPDFHRHRNSRAVMEAFLTQSEKLGWARAFYQLQRTLPQDRAEIFGDAAHSARAAWRYLTPAAPDSSVLVLGISNECIAVEFAQVCSDVIAVDASRLRLAALREHGKFMRLESLFLIHGADVARLPLPEGYFDLVVINDLQDFLPQLPGEQSRQVPLAFLKWVKRLLKPDGSFYVAGDNRFTYTGLFGLRDMFGTQHGTKQGSGGSGSSRKRGRKTSTSSHSYRGYQRALRQAGMYPHTVYAPVPDHRAPIEMVELSGAAGASAASNQGLSTLLKARMRTNPQFLKAFGQSFALLSSAQEVQFESQLERIMRVLRCEIGLPEMPIDEFWMGRTEAAAVCTSPAGQVVFRLPYNRNEAQLALRNSRALQRLHELQLPEALSRLVPFSLYCGEIDGQIVSVELRRPGVRLNEEVKYIRLHEVCAALEPVLLQLAAHRSSGNVAWQSVGRTRFQQVCRETAAGFIDPAIRRSFENLCLRLDRRLARFNMSGILAHGDFRINHIVVDPQDLSPAGILNWGTMTEYALPGWDLISLESSLIQSRSQYSFGESIVWLWDNGYLGGFQPVWRRYFEETGVSEEMRHTILLSFWVRGVWQRFRQTIAALDYEWIRSNVITVLEKIERV